MLKNTWKILYRVGKLYFTDKKFCGHGGENSIFYTFVSKILYVNRFTEFS